MPSAESSIGKGGEFNPVIDRAVWDSRPDFLEDIPFELGFEYKLRPDERARITYMAAVEGNTPHYAMFGLASPEFQADPETTDYLSVWPAQELWHAIILHAVLDIDDGLRESQRHELVASWRAEVEGVQTRAGRAAAIVAPMFRSAYAALVYTKAFQNEETAKAAYASELALTDHPVLKRALPYIIRQEGQHSQFNQRKAIEKLDGNKFAQRVVRTWLRHNNGIVGEPFQAQDVADMMILALYSRKGHDLIPRIDKRVGDLPGLAGNDALQRRLVEAQGRSAGVEDLWLPGSPT